MSATLKFESTVFLTLNDIVHRKVAFVLGELGLEYHSIYLDINKNEHNSAEHTKYNPNGRVPTLIDHSNNDFVIWYVQ